MALLNRAEDMMVESVWERDQADNYVIILSLVIFHCQSRSGGK